ncbi:MAG: copper resistance protein CopC [Acidimicrobiales bacterium]
MLGLGAFVAPLAAHSEVRERSPAPGQILGGTVSRVEILFFVPVETAEITIDGPDGPVDHEPVQLSIAQTVSWVSFQALETPGDYTVTHTETSADGDEQTASFGFRYDPESTVERSPIIAISEGPNWPVLGAIALVVVALVAILAPRPKLRTP